MAALIPFMASILAMYEDLYPTSNRACTASTTTMASSTTVPITRTSANKVIRLILNPAIDMNANVPISDTMIPTSGIRVERISCRKMYTTRITSKIASINVFITSWMEANRKSFELIICTISTPFGRSLRASSRKASICWFTSVALEPAVWNTIQETPTCPLSSPM